MERSVIRDTFSAEKLVPDCAALHPGYFKPVAKMRSIRETGRSSILRFRSLPRGAA